MDLSMDLFTDFIYGFYLRILSVVMQFFDLQSMTADSIIYSEQQTILSFTVE